MQIGSFDRTKDKASIMDNSIKNDDECFQYTVTVTLNHEEIGKTHKEFQTLSLLLLNITHHESIAGKVLWKNNPKIYLNVSYVKRNKYIS